MYIIRRSTNDKVRAELRSSRLEDALEWAASWVPYYREDVEDESWDWEELIDVAVSVPQQFACYSLFADGELQGLRMLEVSEDEVAAYGTHALRLSTAPWNRTPERRYRGVGSLLVAVGLLRSIEDGHKGFMHCSSLPEAQAFHERNGMVCFNGLDDEGLARYRFDERASRDFLARLRRERLLS